MRKALLLAVSVLALAACQPKTGNTVAGNGAAPANTALGGLGAQPAAPMSVAQASAAAVSAADQFAAMAKGSETTGNVPRATDPAAAPLLNSVFNTAPLQGPTPPFSEISTVNNWLQAVLKVGQVYMVAGSGTTDLDSASDEKVGENMIAYAPEVGRYFDAQLTLTGVESAMLASNPDVLNDPSKAAAIAQVRDGVARTMSGSITVIGAEGPTVDWKHARMATLIAVAPQVAKLLAPDALAQLRQDADNAGNQVEDPGLKSDLYRLASLIAPAPSSGTQ